MARISSSSANAKSWFSPKGPLVRRLTASTASGMRSAVLSLTARMPRPPAFVTAATNSGEVGPPIPASTMGWSIPISSVNLVLITSELLSAHGRRRLESVGQCRAHLLGGDLHDLRSHRTQQSQKLVLFGLSDIEVVQRRHQVCDQSVELAVCDAHGRVSLFHAPAGVSTRSTGRLADLVDEQLGESGQVRPRKLQIDPIVPRHTIAEGADNGRDRIDSTEAVVQRICHGIP